MRGLWLSIIFWAEAYLLNFFWEAWHGYYLYWGYHGKSFGDYSISEYLNLIGKVSFVDASILTAIFLVGVLIWRDLRWLKPTFWKSDFQRLFYFLATTIGIAAWIEIKGVYLFHEWSYLASMPTIFGLGISPLVQLVVTGYIAFWLIKSLRLYR